MSAQTTHLESDGGKNTSRRTPPSLSATRIALIVATLITIVLYFIPYGSYVIYPLMLLSTFVHEMGHGLTAVLVGGEFVSFQMWENGSGVAQHMGHYSALDKAAISAGGLLGPAVFGALFFILGRWTKTARLGLYGFGIFSIISVLWVVQNGFAVGFVLGVAAISLLFAHFAPDWLARVFTVFLAVQLTVSSFSRGDYLFMEYADTSAGRMPSDVTQMANALFGPYWLWGGVVAALTVAVLLGGFWFFFRAERQRATDRA